MKRTITLTPQQAQELLIDVGSKGYKDFLARTDKNVTLARVTRKDFCGRNVTQRFEMYCEGVGYTLNIHRDNTACSERFRS